MSLDRAQLRALVERANLRRMLARILAEILVRRQRETGLLEELRDLEGRR